MRRLVDVIIVVGIIVGVIAVSGGYRWFGGACMVIALPVGWKRNWCEWTLMKTGCFAGSSEVNDAVDTSLSESSVDVSSTED